MSDDIFDAGWLALREDADHRSRAEDLARTLAEVGARNGWSRILDLGSGTGSNLRYLASRLPWATSWTLLDHDPALLARARSPEVDSPNTVVGDLAREGLNLIAQADVVTASALLDLVSDDWLGAAVAACAGQGCAVLFALSYDGTIEWRDEDPDDALVRAALNDHQRREKGLGQALGPDATDRTRELFTAAGFHCSVRETPWRLAGSADAALARALIEGWVEASVELRPGDDARIRAWAARRYASLATGAYEVRVGHRDILGLPPGSATVEGATEG